MTSTSHDIRPELEQGVATFLAERTRLFRIARRIVGDPDGADDVVQDAWLRWQRCNRGEIENPAAFLTTATVHLAINLVQSAARRHETPTDVLTTELAELADRGQDPTKETERMQDVAEALRFLATRLTPAERAAYLLRKGFDYPYAQIAHLLQTTTANARQLVRRGQGGLERSGPRPVNPDAHRRLVQAFMTASRTGEFAPLERMLAEAVFSTAACAAQHRPTSFSGPRQRSRPRVHENSERRCRRAAVSFDIRATTNSPQGQE